MPMQGHWQRVNTPLRRVTRRERNVAIGGVAASILAILVIVLATAGNPAPKAAGPGCIYAIIPGVMGAEPVDACGEQAQFVCAKHATGSRPGSETIRRSCGEAGIVISPAAAEQTQTAPRLPHRSTSTGL